jgi:hypothetical protein
MNTFIKQPEESDPSSKEGKRSGAAKKVSRPLAMLLSGSLLAREEVVRHLPFLFFLVFLGLVYIANGYMAEDAVRKINSINTDLKELRSEYITRKSDLMYTTKQSELIQIINQKNLNLEESYQPPKKIVVDEATFKSISE